MSFRDYYLSELQSMGIEVNHEGKAIEQLDKRDLQQLLAVERFKVIDVDCDEAKMF